LTAVVAVIVGAGIASASGITAGTAQSELTALKSADWASNVTVSYPRSGEFKFVSDGIPTYGVPKYYAVPSTASNLLPTASTSTVAATSTFAKSQQYDFVLPTTPQYSTTTTATPLGPIGISVTGAVFFNSYEANDATVALASNFSITRNGITASFVDSCNGHFSPTGEYHYHGLPTCIVRHIEADAGGTKYVHEPALMGVAFDGFGIYDNIAMNGSIVQPSQLDACNGIFSAVPGYPKGIYHYVVEDVKTKQSSIGCFHGLVSSAYTAALHSATGSSSSGPGPGGPPSGAGPQGQGAPATAESLRANTTEDNFLIAVLKATGATC